MKDALAASTQMPTLGDNPISARAVSRFALLFPGREDVRGAVWGQAIKEPVTPVHYRHHLEGLTSLGIYPLRPDGSVRWVAVDVDLPDPERALAVFHALRDLGVDRGVYLERSKSKGFHVLVLFSDWTRPRDVRLIVKVALYNAGLPETTEVFPKQDVLTAETPWGNYLNLPYFGANHPEGRRMILDTRDLTPISLMAWLGSAEQFPVEGLPDVVAGLVLGDQEDSAGKKSRPGVLGMLSQTHSQGTRRPSLVSLAGHLRHRGVAEEVALALLLPWARAHFEPNLPDDEVARHIRGIYRRYGVRSGKFPNNRPGRRLPRLEVGP